MGRKGIPAEKQGTPELTVSPRGERRENPCQDPAGCPLGLGLPVPRPVRPALPVLQLAALGTP